MRARGQAWLIVVALSAALVGCGEEETRYSDARIVDELELEEVEGERDYTMREDPFCTIDRELLNTGSEVEDALEQADIVIASREGNVGVVGVFLAPDCREAARKKLNKLDPAAD